MSAVLRGRRRNLLTVAEFCAVTGDKPDTVRRRLARGDLLGRKIGSRWRVFASEARKQGGR